MCLAEAERMSLVDFRGSGLPPFFLSLSPTCEDHVKQQHADYATFCRSRISISLMRLFPEPRSRRFGFSCRVRLGLSFQAKRQVVEKQKETGWDITALWLS
jgi:hypothetical protein